MWYISISVFLYAIYPMIYSLINNRFHNCFLLCMGVYLLVYIISRLCPEYYRITSLGLPKIPIFIFGCYLGYLASIHKKVNAIYLFLVVVPLIFIFGRAKVVDDFFENPYEDLIRFITLPLCCWGFIFMQRFTKHNILLTFFRFLGRYSLELYILHMLLYGVVFNSCNTALSLPLCGVLLFILSLILCQPVHIFIDSIIQKIK